MKERLRRAAVDLLLLVCVAVAAVFTLRGDGGAGNTTYSALSAAVTAAPTIAPAPADVFRAEREKTRAREIAALETLASQADTDAALKAQASRALLDLNTFSEQELAVEAALSGMNLSGVASVSGKLAYVFVAQRLTAEQAALLFSAVQEITALSGENIRVSDGNSVV